MSNFTNNLKRLMNEQMRTQYQVAEALGVTQQTVSAWMTGASEPRMSKVDKIAEYFHVTRADLVEPCKDNKDDNKRELVLLLAYAQKLASLNEDDQEMVFNLIDNFIKKEKSE